MISVMKCLTKKDHLFGLFSLVFIILGVWLDLKLPEYMAEITELVKTPGSTLSDITMVGISMVSVALLSLVTAVFVGFFIAKIAANLSKTLRQKTYIKTMSFSKEEINKFSVPSLITRSTNDITQIQQFVMFALLALVKAPIMAVWAISKIVGKSEQWTMATAISVFLMMLVFAFFVALVLPKFSKIQKLTDDINRVSRETITGVRVVRAYNAQQYQAGKFADINNELTKNHLFTTTAFSFLHPSMTIIMMGLSLAIYLIGAFMIQRVEPFDQLSLFADMIVFSSYAVQIVMAFLMIAVSFIVLPRASVSAKRLNEIFNTESKIKFGTKTHENSGLEGKLEFKNISFKYPDAEEYTLENISFTADKGQTVAFIGATGSGKSTLIDLIPRFYEPTEGIISINGLDIKEYTKEALCDKLGYVSQKAVLFSDTVSSNITYGDDDVTDSNRDMMVQSSEIAMAYEFINKMEDKYEAQIAQGGMNISGGQKQRLSIARAIYKRPEIYIFDDSFSALDYKTDRTLRANLKKYFSGVTTLIVAQRVGTILDADKIIVIEDGCVVGTGTHKELLKTNDIYREIAKSQLSEEELNNAR